MSPGGSEAWSPRSKAEQVSVGWGAAPPPLPDSGILAALLWGGLGGPCPHPGFLLNSVNGLSELLGWVQGASSLCALSQPSPLQQARRGPPWGLFLQGCHTAHLPCPLVFELPAGMPGLIPLEFSVAGVGRGLEQVLGEGPGVSESQNVLCWTHAGQWDSSRCPQHWPGPLWQECSLCVE